MNHKIYLSDWKACGCLKNCVCKHSKGIFGGWIEYKDNMCWYCDLYNSKSDFSRDTLIFFSYTGGRNLFFISFMSFKMCALDEQFFFVHFKVNYEGFNNIDRFFLVNISLDLLGQRVNSSKAKHPLYTYKMFFIVHLFNISRIVDYFFGQLQSQLWEKNGVVLCELLLKIWTT